MSQLLGDMLTESRSRDWRTPAEVYLGTQEATGGSEAADAAVTPIALRATSVTAAPPNRLHLDSHAPWS